MKQKLIFILVPLACIIGFLMWWFSTTQVLLRRSADLIDCVRMEKDTGRIQRAFKAENLRDLVASTITITYPQMETTFSHSRSSNEPITLSEDRAKASLLYLTEMAEWITVEDESIAVLSTDEKSAEVKVSFDLAAKLKGKPEQSSAMQGTFSFQYINNRWLVDQATFE
jgi:hypothetical protein